MKIAPLSEEDLAEFKRELRGLKAAELRVVIDGIADLLVYASEESKRRKRKVRR